MEIVLKVNGAGVDRRRASSRQSLLRAFIELAGERPYASIRIADIADRANVGRSTFYAHFRSKDELLLCSMDWMFNILAEAAVSDTPGDEVRRLVEHFWSNRRLARSVLAPNLERKIRRALCEVITRRLADAASFDVELSKLAAAAIAAGQLGILEAWTKGDFAAPPAQVAAMMVSLAAARPIVPSREE